MKQTSHIFTSLFLNIFTKTITQTETAADVDEYDDEPRDHLCLWNFKKNLWIYFAYSLLLYQDTGSWK